MFYFLTGYLDLDKCPLYFLETAPSVLYLVTGLIYIANYTLKMYEVECRLWDSVEIQERIRKRRNIVIVILVIIAVSFLATYSVDTIRACAAKKDEGDPTKANYWDGWTTLIGYFFTFCILLFQAKHEWNFMNK